MKKKKKIGGKKPVEFYAPIVTTPISEATRQEPVKVELPPTPIKPEPPQNRMINEGGFDWGNLPYKFPVVLVVLVLSGLLVGSIVVVDQSEEGYQKARKGLLEQAWAESRIAEIRSRPIHVVEMPKKISCRYMPHWGFSVCRWSDHALTWE